MLVMEMSNKKQQIPAIRFNGFTDAWEQRELKEILKVNSGRDYKHLGSGSIPVYGTGGYMLSVNDKLSDKDAIGIGRKGTIDKPQYLKAPFWTVDTLFFMIPLNNFDLQFLYTMAQKINWKKMDESTGVPSLSKAVIEKVKQNIPSYQEQIKIGDFFKQLDDTIALHQRQLNKFNKMKKTMLQKMFPQNGEKFPEIRFDGFTKEWNERKLIDVADIYDNLRVPVTASDRVKGNIPYYGANGIQDYVEGFTHDGEFILIAEDGANDLVNYPVNYVNGKVWVNNHAHVVSGKKESLDNLFLASRIRSMNISTWLVGGGRAKLNGEVLKKIPLMIPSLEEQTKIGDFFKQLDGTIVLHQQKIRNYQEIKKVMLQQMFV